ncbi:MAG: GNAT family N-acetyltransferase [Nocardiopsaceae bacterium]|nr:GNAT family N-acetyltransferase [Nocardiopsaceae bacterium]
MRIVRYDPADEAAARGCYEMYRAAQEADEPFGMPLTARVLRFWLAETWTSDPVETWYVPGEAPGTWAAMARLELPDLENRHRAGLTLTVHPGRRRAGIGTALLRHAAERAAEHGRTVLTGHVPRGSAGEAFARRAGATEGIEEVRRQHDLRATPDGLLASLRETAEKAAEGYSLVTWTGPVPAERLEQLAGVFNALNDAPHDASREDDHWDGARVRDRWNRRVTRLACHDYALAAVHEATGEMAAVTQVAVDPDTPEWGAQLLTAVTGPHRGHRLGLLTKVAMAQWLLEAEPGLRRIETWNAASNRHMIAVNEQLGYEVAGPVSVSVELPVESVVKS